MRKIIFRFMAGLLFLTSALSCNKYLDIVPDDGIATIDMAFNMRSQAIKYLSSCYQYMADRTAGALDYEGFSAGDEIFVAQSQTADNYWKPKCTQIHWGWQNVSSVYNNDFQAMYQAIRYCNTLVDEIDKVPDMEVWEKEQWKAEAKTLKAYYMFHLMRKWGPIPIAKENLPVSADVQTTRVSRNTIDECFDYVLALLDEAIPNLFDKPLTLDDYGRITAPMAATLKAKIAVTAASPLFNGNEEQRALVNRDGTRLFPSKNDEQKAQRWTYAVQACEDAIAACDKAGISGLYSYKGTFRGDPHLVRELTLRNCICEDFNTEVIWANTQISSNDNMWLQRFTASNTAAEKYPDMRYFRPVISVPMKVVNQFYTLHGIPVENDLVRKDVDPEMLRAGTDVEDERWYIQKDYQTAEFNFDREPRFYAYLSFDGAYWFNALDNDQTPDQLPTVKKAAGAAGRTCYGIKKLCNLPQVINSASSVSVTTYIFPCMRLADLYLLYAEAVNEAEGPSGAHAPQMFTYLDAIRARAGIPGVKEAWDTYSDTPGKYSTKAGMREIIRRERGIELAFEGERFWDIRRWKTAPAEYAKNVYGWDDSNNTSRNKYYKITLIYETKFALKDYFWPFSTAILENNPNLVQNLGW